MNFHVQIHKKVTRFFKELARFVSILCMIKYHIYTKIGYKSLNRRNCIQYLQLRAMEKVKLQVYIDKDVDRKLRELIQVKHKEYCKGLLSYEVEMALREWMALHTRTQTLEEPSCVKYVEETVNPPFRIGQVFNQVKEYLLKTHYDTLQSGQVINRKHLEEAIGAVRGTDRRTIRKWIETFHKYHLLKFISPMAWEVV